jgi:hypothetical protein
MNETKINKRTEFSLKGGYNNIILKKMVWVYYA